MDNQIRDFIIETFKEAARLVVLGAAALSPYIFVLMDQYEKTGDFHFSWKIALLYFFFGLTGLKAISQGLHESGISDKSLTRF